MLGNVPHFYRRSADFVRLSNREMKRKTTVQWSNVIIVHCGVVFYYVVDRTKVSGSSVEMKKQNLARRHTPESSSSTTNIEKKLVGSLFMLFMVLNLAKSSSSTKLMKHLVCMGVNAIAKEINQVHFI